MLCDSIGMTLDEAEELAWDLMEEHGIYDFDFQFNNSKTSLGKCRYGNHRVIFLSRWFVLNNSKEEIIDTILHEIAHALDFYDRGTSDHGKNWRKHCVRIGCVPKSCSENTIKPNNHYKYVDTCGCGITYRRHRVRRHSLYRCPKCQQELYVNDRYSKLLEKEPILAEIYGYSK